MLLKSIFLANAIAGAVASPASLHKRQDVDSYIQAEKPVALQGILNNFGPKGNLSRGAAPGIPVAGSSETNPPYIYTWTRDSGLTMQSLIHEFLAGNASLEPLIQQYITSQANIQAITNPSGPLSDGSGLGEPKFNINLTAYTGPWSRPQREGPAVRASALVAYGNYLLSQGQRDEAVQNVWSVLRNDLTYVGQYWNHTGFDLWEEVNGTSFFTIAVQHKALVEGQTFAEALGQTCGGCAVAPELLCHLQEYWNGTAIVSNYPTANDPKGRSGVDINSVLTVINTFDPAAGCDDVIFQPCSARALSNHKILVDSFRAIYGVNQGRTAGQAAAVGRYPEDVFMGGNPWYLATLASAEMLYDALHQWDHQHAIHITNLSLPFFTDLLPNIKRDVYPISTPTYQKITNMVRTYADGFISVVQEHSPADGGLSEEYDRGTRAQVSAPDLTWSYTTFLTAVARRDGSVPPSWGSSAALKAPGKCTGASVKGSYAAAKPSWYSTIDSEISMEYIQSIN